MNEDAIDRKLVCAFIDGLISDDGERKKGLECIRSMPPVNPQPKTGHWIFDDECKEHGHCSQCGYGSVDLVDGESHNFCRNCGAWMVEPQERSDKA